MSNKMLIDASHPEETRVAVVRGNRIEEFDFESQEKRQLRGNIYLAKVTRVEPSLQAAFVDYGGNRHGFLAFSEIHPDYYQIPVADRQALIEAEAAEARASREAEEAEDDRKIDGSDDDDEITEQEESAPKMRRRRKPRQAKKSDDAQENVTSDENGASQEKEVESNKSQAAEADTDVAEEGEQAEEPKKKAPARRKPRTRKAAASKNKEDEESTEKADTQAAENADEKNGSEDDSNDGSPTIMAAMVETDSISEALPGEEDDVGSESESDDDETVTDSNEEKKPRRRTSRRRKAPVKAEEEESAQDAADSQAPSDNTDQENNNKEDAGEEETKSKRRTSRRRPARKKQAEAEAKEDQSSDSARGDMDNVDDNDNDGNSGANDVESVGQDDALEEVPEPARSRRQYKIQEVIKRRQVMLIQVVKEERGNKGAALTTYLSLAGRYSVLMPNTARGGGISRKITNSADRKRLKTIAAELEVPEGMGVILRTAGASRTKEEIDRDFQYLMRLWEQVRNLTLASSAPCLVYEEGSLIKRSIRDLYNKDTGEILVSGENGYREARDLMEMLMPDHVDKVKQYTGAQAIFTKFGVEAQLENMVSPQVTLKSGGYLVINQTEALVAVDVNSGRATREHSVEKTALQTNLEAAEEVARQLRLRDLAGLIVIDFIDMDERRNNRAVEKKLKDCLKHDRARIQVGRISHFGLMEMSRQRIRASVLESTMDVCPHCSGVGHVRSESAIALHVFRALEEHVERNRNRDAIVKTTPSIASHILNHKRSALVELEGRYGIHLIVITDPEMQGQEFRIEKGEKSQHTDSAGPVGYEGDSQTQTETNDEEQKGRKKRGRRRSKNRDNENRDGDSLDQESGETATVDAKEETEENAEEGRSKRRRGKRGGRRRRESDQDATTESSGNIDEEVQADINKSSEKDSSKGRRKSAKKAETKEAKSDSKSSEPSELSAEADTKPKTRSTRRKKAPIQAPAKQETEPASQSDESASDAQAGTPPPPRPPRRATRRVKEDAGKTEAAADDTAESVKTEEVKAESKSEETSSEKPKRRGWWNRGNGFF